MSGGAGCQRRVVVTGIGLVTCLGTGTRTVWKRLVDGKCGIIALTGKEFEKLPSRVAGVVLDGEKDGEFNLKGMDLKVDLRSCSRSSLFALAAADEAVSQAKLDLTSKASQIRTGVVIGMSMLSLDEILKASQRFVTGYNKLNPYFIPKILPNMAAGLVSMQYGIKGLNHSAATACTTGVHSIGDASRFIQHGDIDVAICGSTEAAVDPFSMAGFSRLRALSTKFNADPLRSSRPFDASRDGFVMSEGACVMILESLESATKRGVEPMAEILGYGLSSDANHITSPSPNGEGAQRCMMSALRDAGIDPREIGYVNAHATSTPMGDEIEARAIHRTFVIRCDIPNGSTNCVDAASYDATAIFKGPMVSSTKGAVGHMLGAAGSVEAAFTALACKEGVVPPSLNLEDSSTVGVELDFVRNESRTWVAEGNTRRIGITNSFGFGGTNASLCIGQFVSS